MTKSPAHNGLTHCFVCGRTLRDAASAEIGVGPICRERLGLPDTLEGREVVNKLVYQVGVQLDVPSIDGARKVVAQIREAGFAKVAEMVERVIEDRYVVPVDLLVEMDSANGVAEAMMGKFSYELLAVIKSTKGRKPTNTNGKWRWFVPSTQVADLVARAKEMSFTVATIETEEVINNAPSMVAPKQNEAKGSKLAVIAHAIGCYEIKTARYNEGLVLAIKKIVGRKCAKIEGQFVWSFPTSSLEQAKELLKGFDVEWIEAEKVVFGEFVEITRRAFLRENSVAVICDNAPEAARVFAMIQANLKMDVTLESRTIRITVKDASKRQLKNVVAIVTALGSVTGAQWEIGADVKALAPSEHVGLEMA